MRSHTQPQKLEITKTLVTTLLAEQFPQFAHLPIKLLEPNGSDNRTFRLGDKMLVRLPSAEPYALQVAKEQKWLPRLKNHLSFPIPTPLALGQPSKHYLWHWSIYAWLDGESANTQFLDDKTLKLIAVDLSQFLKELQQIDVREGPLPGLHNYWRGDTPAVYDADTRAYLAALQDIIDSNVALSLWEKAINTPGDQKQVWIHGDFASGNILIKANHLAAVIDFGCMAVGDPACDLVIAWTFLKNDARKIFKDHLSLDQDTWTRARGWALWKAAFELCMLSDKTSVEAMKQRCIIKEILQEHYEETR